MAGRLILGIFNPALNANGVVDSGCTLTFYANGSTTVLQTIYADAALQTPLANPLACDAAGRYPMIWGADGAVYSVKVSPTGVTPITYDNIGLAADPNSATQYLPLSRYVPSVLTDAQIIVDWNVPFSLTLPAGLDDGSFASIFTLSANPAAPLVLTLKKNSTTLGTVTFSTGGVPTVSIAAQTDFVPGNKFYVIGQGSHDSTGAGLSMTILFRLTQ